MNRHRPGYFKDYYATHTAEHKVSQQKYDAKNPRIHKPDSMRGYRLRYLYKMTVERYEALLSSQGGHCALCQATQDSNERRMAVDHNHECCSGKRSCGKCLRGILCANCNRKLGFLEVLLKQTTMVVPKWDTWLEDALLYLARYGCR